MSHTPQGVDKLLIRPATKTPSRRHGGVGHITVKTQKVRVFSSHDTAADAYPGNLSEAPLILTECSVRRPSGRGR